QARPVAVHAVRAGFVAGLNDVFLVGAVLAIVASALTFVLIRTKDFETGAARVAPPATSPAHPQPAEPAVRS
ncbi:MAG: MFS transporter, partial [Solirubrobacteraceae bacterium]